MRCALALVCLVVASTCADAGDNPNVNIFLEFAGGTNEIYPAPGHVTATVYLESFGPSGGTLGLEFAISASPGLVLMSYNSLLDGADIGDPTSGWFVTSSSCAMPDGQGRLAVAEVTYYYSGTPGVLEIVSNPGGARGVTDCNLDEDQWCVRLSPSGHGGVWMAPPPGDCPPADPHPHRMDVPSEYSTIQAGIDAAAVGDTVLVAAGTYSTSTNGETFPLTMKSGVYLLGESGPFSTIVDAQSQARVMDCDGASSATIIEGLAFSNGYVEASNGAGVSCVGSSPQFVSCWFSHNEIHSDVATAHGGAGLYGNSASELTVTDCTFTGNIFTGTSGSLVGAALKCGPGSVSGCSFKQNDPSPAGVATVYFTASVGAVVSDCAVFDNTKGGVYFLSVDDASVEDCLIEGNGAGYQVWGSHSPLTISGSTIYGGEVTAISVFWDPVVIENTIVAFNAGDAVGCASGATATVTCSDFYGNGGDWVGCVEGMNGVDGNLSADPLFCDPSLGHFGLCSDSPCQEGMNPECGLIGYYGVQCADCAPVDIEVTPLSLQFDLFTGQRDSAYVSVANWGTAPLEWWITEEPPGAVLGRRQASGGSDASHGAGVRDTSCVWLDENPGSGTVAAGAAPDTIVVSVDASGLSTGSYACDIAVHSDDPDEPVVLVPVTMSVSERPVHAFLRFENDQNYVEPEPYTTITATLFLDGLDAGEGITEVDFMVERSFGGITANWTNLLGGLTFGTPETGCVVAGACAQPDSSGRVAIAEMSYVYDGTPGDLQLAGHPEYGRTAYDCASNARTWCVDRRPSGHAGVGVAPPPGDCDIDRPHLWRVPSQVATISAAVDSAAYGDTVLVATGTYSGETGETFPISLKNGLALVAESSPVVVLREEPYGSARGPILTCDGVDSTAVVMGIDFEFGEYDPSWPPKYPVFDCVGSSPRVSFCSFSGCRSATFGAGVRCRSSSPEFSFCGFEDNINRVGFGGAGCLVEEGSVGRFVDCRFYENVGLWGGAARVDPSSEAIFNRCCFWNNHADAGGGGVYNEGETTLSSCTLVLNSSTPDTAGSAVYCSHGATCLLEACLIAHNYGTLPVACDDSVAIVIVGTDIYEPLIDPWVGDLESEYGSMNDNFYAEPFFVNAYGGDLFLLENSPCLPGVSPSGELVGCFGVGTAGSYVPKTLFVPDIFPTIGEAIAAATATDTIRVSEGTYCYDETFPLRLHSGAVLLGAGAVETTIMPPESDLRVLEAGPADDFAQPIVRAVQIYRGSAPLSGGGMAISRSGSVYQSYTPGWLFQDCEFSQSSAEYGGAVFVGQSRVAFSGCRFYYNEASSCGGAVVTTGPVEFADCIFAWNSAENDGGAIWRQLGPLAVDGCTFHGNSAEFGSGITNSEWDTGSSVAVERTIVSGGLRGEGIRDDAQSLVLSCCDLYGNQGGDWVGSIASQADTAGNFSAPPDFCYTPPVAMDGYFMLSDESPCLPGNSPCGELVGALGMGACDGLDIAVSPSSISFELAPGQSDTAVLQLWDDSYYPSTPWSFLTAHEVDGRTGNLEFPSDMPHEAEVVPAGREHDAIPIVRSGASSGGPGWRGGGGPDPFGYTWTDSDEPGGPEYVWEDISSVGTEVTLSDESDILVQLPFSFPFYGLNRTTVGISSNGFLTFAPEHGELTWDVRPIPVAGYPNAMIAPFWTDLDPDLGGSIYHYGDAAGGRFVVQYDDVPFYNSTDGHSFQAILHRSGEIVFHYQDVNAPEPTAMYYCTGIENDDGTGGLGVAYCDSLIHDEMAVRITGPGYWLSWDPVGGLIDYYGTGEVNIVANATGLEEGAYTSALLVLGDDPSQPQVPVPITLNVTSTGIEEEGVPRDYALHANHPNPFNPITTISYDLPVAGKVELSVYNVAGRLVRSLIRDQVRPAGRHAVTWDGCDDNQEEVASGVYFYRIEAGEFRDMRQMVLLK
ncbi:MAG: DUF1565 domain-containing protein [Thermoleophilia bacterium]|nr:DUF1565 domain-containing protein [Thermoleophilia bacterium]